MKKTGSEGEKERWRVEKKCGVKKQGSRVKKEVARIYIYIIGSVTVCPIKLVTPCNSQLAIVTIFEQGLY